MPAKAYHVRSRTYEVNNRTFDLDTFWQIHVDCSLGDDVWGIAFWIKDASKRNPDGSADGYLWGLTEAQAKEFEEAFTTYVEKKGRVK